MWHLHVTVTQREGRVRTLRLDGVGVSSLILENMG
jgi:hypothetical protein